MQIKLSPNAYLKFLKLKDAKELFELVDENRDYLCNFLQWPRISKTVDDSIYFINQTIKSRKEKDINVYGIFFKDELAGIVGYNDFDRQNKRAPIGYWIGSKFQGKGLVTMSVKSLVEYGFNEMDLNRIEICCAVDNIPSQKVAERLGFEFEGIAKAAEIIGDKVLDHKVYSLINSSLST